MSELDEIRNMLKNIIEVDQVSNRAQLFLEGLKHSGKAEIANFAISDECNAMLAAAKEQNYSALQQLMSQCKCCLLYTSPSPRDLSTSRMPSSA